MFVSNRKIRVLVADVGSDDQSRRTTTLAEFLRDAGMDIVGASRCDSPEKIAAAAVGADVDVVGLSLNGARNTLCEQVVALLRASSMDDCLVIACDALKDGETKTLEQHGVSKAFPSGVSPSAVVDFVQSHVRPPWSLPDAPQFMELAMV
ncbi:MAG TPA: hypothetical protein VFI71_06105 [Pyrinomonadaceae bacterium]|nr:hypothetical protein [Pyrinomonadaceae bacterium]